MARRPRAIRLRAIRLRAIRLRAVRLRARCERSDCERSGARILLRGIALLRMGNVGFRYRNAAWGRFAVCSSVAAGSAPESD